MSKRPAVCRKTVLLMGVLVCGAPQISLRAEQPMKAASVKEAYSDAQSAPSRSEAWHARGSSLSRRKWGLDIVGVRRVSSGEMLEFRYRVLDPAKAKIVNDKASQALMIDQKSGVRLTVPQMEKVGLLRTTATPQLNRMYWMVFANTGDLVKPGNLVNVSIGAFHVDGLVVE